VKCFGSYRLELCSHRSSTETAVGSESRQRAQRRLYSFWREPARYFLRIAMIGVLRKIGRESVKFVLAGARGFLRPYSPAICAVWSHE